LPEPKIRRSKMSEKEIAKKAFAEIEEEKTNKAVKQVKEIVTKTLEKLDTVKKEIKKLQDEEKVLKMDIDDLKEGRLDRISERQEKDPEAKKVSVVVIIKEKEVIRETSPWYWPYQVVWQIPTYTPPIFPPLNPIYGGGNNICYTTTTAGNGYSSSFAASSSGNTTATLSCGDVINCSVAKNATIGTYDIQGHIVHLR
jgi:regulator of replication initiation timing